MSEYTNAFFHEFSGDSPSGTFHKVIALREASEFSWEEIKKKAPDICKGWFELSHLGKEERLEFIEQFWEGKMCQFPKFCHFFEKFFKDVENIEIYLTQKTFDDPFESQLVYRLKDNGGFFRG